MPEPLSIEPEARGATATRGYVPAAPLTPPADERSSSASTVGPSNAADAPMVRPAVVVTLPLRTSSIGNKREHAFTRARRVRGEIGAVLAALAGDEPPPLPVTIELHRIGWNRLDPLDGLPSAMKAPLDALAHWLRCDDRDPRLYLRLSQGTTREVRHVRDGRGRVRREAASSLRISVRPWCPADGVDPLVVRRSPPRGKP